MRLCVTGGPRLDRTQARVLVEAWTDALLPYPIADRAYDRDAWRAQRDIEASIPVRRRRTNPQPHDSERYPARNAVERGINGFKHR